MRRVIVPLYMQVSEAVDYYHAYYLATRYEREYGCLMLKLLVLVSA